MDALCLKLAIEHPRFYLLHPLGFHFLLFKPRFFASATKRNNDDRQINATTTKKAAAKRHAKENKSLNLQHRQAAATHHKNTS